MSVCMMTEGERVNEYSSDDEGVRTTVAFDTLSAEILQLDRIYPVVFKERLRERHSV